MKKIIILLTAMGVFFTTGCSDPYALSDKYDEGYESGYDEGYKAAKNEWYTWIDECELADNGYYPEDCLQDYDYYKLDELIEEGYVSPETLEKDYLYKDWDYLIDEGYVNVHDNIEEFIEYEDYDAITHLRAVYDDATLYGRFVYDTSTKLIHDTWNVDYKQNINSKYLRTCSNLDGLIREGYSFCDCTKDKFSVDEIVMESVNNSSVISAMGFDSEKSIMLLRFKDSDALYAYYNMSMPTYNEMKFAESKGDFLNNNIKGKYVYERIE